ncbi:MAG: N-acetylmuramoyl-L-alanine amidase [Candidatus Methylomirabilales bacterium]
MRRFLPREKIRSRLLQGVYEQNLVILGTRPAFRRARRFPLRPGALSAVLLGLLLLGSAIPLDPFPGDSAPAASAPQPGAARTVPAEPAVPAAAGREREEAPPAASDVAEYQSLTKGRRLELRKVFGLGVKTIMIDPGHGGSAHGAVGKGGTAEKGITLDIARRLKAALERDTDYRILLTREEDRDLSLKSRVDLTNESRADLFVSIHVNALPFKPLDIVETYYFGPSQDSQTLALAAEVNDGSDYSYSEYAEVIKEIANQLKYQESRRLARAVQDSLFQGLRKRKADVVDHGVKRAPFLVLLGVEMPGVLVEVACLSNPEAEDRLQEATYREAIAQSIQLGILRYLGTPSKRSGVS